MRKWTGECEEPTEYGAHLVTLFRLDEAVFETMALTGCSGQRVDAFALRRRGNENALKINSSCSRSRTPVVSCICRRVAFSVSFSCSSSCNSAKKGEEGEVKMEVLPDTW